jgi:hypothetical protein
MVAELNAAGARAQDEDFVSQCCLENLQAHLPLLWPTPPHAPPSPKKQYRSHYCYLGWHDLLEPGVWHYMSEFGLLLRLIDCNGLRPVLAQRLGWTSAQGQIPFDPVSMFLLHGWQTTNGWSRAQTLSNLRNPRYADYVQRFGFDKDRLPTEGGLRYFLTALGYHSDADGQTIALSLADEPETEVAVQHLNDLIAQSVHLIRDSGLLTPEAWHQALVCPDGMLHEAASRLRCASVQESCYQPTRPDQSRPCPAKQKDKRGCDCDTSACAQMCHCSTPRDRSARFIFYAGSNQPTHNPNQATKPSPDQKIRGQRHYGYRSLPLQLADPQRRFSLVLMDDFRPANQREDVPTAALLLQLSSFYPNLQLDTVAGDAGFGYDIILSTVYHLGARRCIDLRSHTTDQDKANWPLRGYDDKGRPICPFGYPCKANGFDAKRQRHKWVCNQTCLKGTTPAVPLEDVTYPPPQCPFLSPHHPHGQVINVGQHFPDGSIRLVRDIPVGTPAWKRLYHRARNAVEGRNAAFKLWNLKRLPVYGQLRSKATVFLADTWLNLTTLARLVREATLVTRSAST